MSERKEKEVATFSYSDVCNVRISTENVIIFRRFGDGVSSALHSDDRSIPPIEEIPKDTDYILFADRYYIYLSGIQVRVIDRNVSKRIYVGKKSTDMEELHRRHPEVDISTVDFPIETVNDGLVPVYKGSIEGKDYVLRE